MQRENILLDKGIIGLALRPWGDPAAAPIDLYRRLLKELEARTGQRCVLLPMHHPDDLDFARRISPEKQHHLIEGAYPPNLVLGLVSKMSTVVAMRLHALIFAARAGVPPFALAYDPKVRQLMKLLGLEESTVDWNGFDPARVAAQVADTISHRIDAVTRLREQTIGCEAAALRNCDIALAVLGA